jgi:hypothetical protein
MRRRLEELNWRTKPGSLNNEVFNSKPGEVISTPVSLKVRKKKNSLKARKKKIA